MPLPGRLNRDLWGSNPHRDLFFSLALNPEPWYTASMTKTERIAAVKQARKDLRQAEASLKSLLRAAGDDLGCDGTGEEARDLRGQIRSLVRDLADLGDRKTVEDYVYRHTHRDYKSRIQSEGGKRYILTHQPGSGARLCALDSLTMDELLAKV